MSELEISRIKEILPRLKVAHHIPGRARLKLDGKPPAWAFTERMDKYVGAIEGVTSVSVNILNASAVVNYDKSVISPAIFDALAHGDATPFMEKAERLKSIN